MALKKKKSLETVEENTSTEKAKTDKSTKIKYFFLGSGATLACISVLLGVLLVCGVFLTLMHGLLAVSDEERLDRAIQKIYGKTVSTTAQTDTANYETNAYKIDEAYLVKNDGNYLVKATGKGGFDNGTVTCWIVVEVTGGSVSGVGKIIIDSNVGQSYIDRVTSKALNQFSELYKDDIYYTPNLITAATVTLTKTAICNAVNGSLEYVLAKTGGGKTNPYEGFLYTDFIETKLTTHTPSTEEVSYNIVTTGYGNASSFTVNITVDKSGAITEYEIVTNGSTAGYDGSMKPEILAGTMFTGKKIGDITAMLSVGMEYPGDSMGTEISTGATQSNFLCTYAAAFATANYEKLLAEPEEGGDENE